MSAPTALPRSPELLETEWTTPDRGKVGIVFLIVTETALFTMFVAAYVIYIGKSLTGPYPKDVLENPIDILRSFPLLIATICLLSSSGTIVLAEHALEKEDLGRFKVWWVTTLILGVIFLAYTGTEWHHLITIDHLTISTNLFGTTFYSLVGLHASHVIVGAVFITLVLVVTLRGFPIISQKRRVQFLSWYWHFVDGVWVVVFTVVYIISR